MELLIVLAVVIFVGLMIFLKEKFGPKEPDHTNKRRPNPINKPQKSVENDKVIVVNNVKLEYLKKSIQQYCNLHNYPEYLIFPRLTKIEKLGVVTFPLNI